MEKNFNQEPICLIIMPTPIDLSELVKIFGLQVRFWGNSIGSLYWFHKDVWMLLEKYLDIFTLIWEKRNIGWCFWLRCCEINSWLFVVQSVSLIMFPSHDSRLFSLGSYIAPRKYFTIQKIFHYLKWQFKWFKYCSRDRKYREKAIK